jgi:hypothetical protein
MSAMSARRGKPRTIGKRHLESAGRVEPYPLRRRAVQDQFGAESRDPIAPDDNARNGSFDGVGGDPEGTGIHDRGSVDGHDCRFAGHSRAGVVRAAIELCRFITLVKVEDEDVLPARKRRELESSAGSGSYPLDGNMHRGFSIDCRDH